MHSQGRFSDLPARIEIADGRGACSFEKSVDQTGDECICNPMQSLARSSSEPGKRRLLCLFQMESKMEQTRWGCDLIFGHKFNNDCFDIK
jgi:hypothetical protein